MVNFSSDKRGPYIRNPVQLDTLSKSIYAGAATVSVIYDLLAKQAFAFVLWVTHLSYSVTYNTCLYIRPAYLPGTVRSAYVYEYKWLIAPLWPNIPLGLLFNPHIRWSVL